MIGIIQGDAARIPLPTNSAHCVITSPPYYRMRLYHGDQTRGRFPDLGAEPTPDEYIDRMRYIFKDVKRVLRPDGIAWLNLGDGHSGGGRGGNLRKSSKGWKPKYQTSYRGMPQGNKLFVPQRVAMALQNDGWIVRGEVIWSKPNPMTDPIGGRRFQADSCDCVSERREAMIAANSGKGIDRSRVWGDGHGKAGDVEPLPECDQCGGSGRVGLPKYRNGSWRHTVGHEYIYELTTEMGYWSNQEAIRRDAGVLRGDSIGSISYGKNPRSVLSVATVGYGGGHYAAFPPRLLIDLIYASCPRWSCPECGTGFSPVVEVGGKTTEQKLNERGFSGKRGSDEVARQPLDYAGGHGDNKRARRVVGYNPTCDHNCGLDDAIPGIVLDPFVGSGTTVKVARELGRRAIGLDISHKYLDRDAKVRIGIGAPSNELDQLPLFEGKDETIQS